MPSTCAQLTRDLFAIAKFLFFFLERTCVTSYKSVINEMTMVASQQPQVAVVTRRVVRRG